MATTLATRLATSCCLVAQSAPKGMLASKAGRAITNILLIRSKQTTANTFEHSIRQPKVGFTKKSGSGPVGGGGSSKRTLLERKESSADDGAWSVIAYNLSDELKIDNVHKLLQSFDEYHINRSLPDDIQDEAVLLSLKTSDRAGYGSSQLNDIFLFREGSIVFWGVPYEQQKRLLYSLSSLKVNPNTSDYIKEEREHMSYALSDAIDKSHLSRDTIHIATSNRDESCMKLDQFAFSHAVALSVKLGIWEMMLDEYIESVEWITENMKEGKDIKLTRDQVFKKTGEILCLKHSINLSSDLLDLPDVYWDRSDQENMFSSLFAYLNIRRRTNVMNEKLNNCCELMTLLAGHMNDRHHIRLEWMIIVLITVEVLFEVARFI